MSVNRCMLETVVKGVGDFVEYFCETLLKLKTHVFIAE